MVFKGLFKSGSDGKDKRRKAAEGRPVEPTYTIEDLIILERFEEAEARLLERTKAQPSDLHARLKLADVLGHLRKLDRAAAEFVLVADDYAREGLIDKALAVVARALKVAPLDEGLQQRAHAFREAKKLEHKREAAIAGLRAGRMGATAADTWILQLPKLWRHLATSDLVLRLDADQISQLFAACTIERHPPGTLLVEKGSPLAELFILVSGVLEARVPSSEAALRSFGPRDILGERALFEQRPWPATYRVAEKLVLLRLDRSGLEQALQGNRDPRGFLLVLREQRNDQQVEALVESLS